MNDKTKAVLEIYASDGQDFTAKAQGKVDFTVPVTLINGMMAICTESFVIYITKDQSESFFSKIHQCQKSQILETQVIYD